MFSTLFGWLFGRKRAPQPPAADERKGFEQLNRNAPLRTEAADEDAEGAGRGFLCREAVLGRNQRIAGYQFMLQEAVRARIRRSSRRIHHVYAEVLVHDLAHADIGELLGHRLAFLDLPDSFLSHPSLLGLPAANVVIMPTLHDDEGAPEPAALHKTVESLRQRGFRLGLPDPSVVPEFAHLLPMASFIIAPAHGLDPRRGLRLSNIALEIADNARLLIRDLPSLDDFRFSYKLGAALFQGPFVTSREAWEDRDPGPSTLRIGVLIARVRADADTRELAELFKQDAALSLRLLRYLNSAAIALPQRVSSIEHALALLGREKLYRWLVLLVCSADADNERGSAALETALVRGRMMELMGASRTAGERDALFLVGLLSLVDVIMQVPLEKALAPLALSPEIEAALREGSGPHAALLELAIACERADSEQIRELASRCAISPEQASECHMQALGWAMQLQE